MCTVLADQIKRLELELLHSNVKITPSILDMFLAVEFEEISSDGTKHSRQAVVEWLLNKDPKDRWSLTDFRARKLSGDLILVVYHAKKTIGKRNDVGKGSIRSSIWRHNEQGWQMVFHQASKII